MRGACGLVLFVRFRLSTPGVEVDYLHIDAATIFMVTDPSRFDVIVTDNLFGDIITDLAGAVGGGIGMAASANLNPSGSFPSMFEPVHGSAPDIAGTGKADPTAAIMSAALLLEHTEVSLSWRTGLCRRSHRMLLVEVRVARLEAPPRLVRLFALCWARSP
jgi:hypothetical protein